MLLPSMRRREPHVLLRLELFAVPKGSRGLLPAEGAAAPPAPGLEPPTVPSGAKAPAAVGAKAVAVCELLRLGPAGGRCR